MANFKYTGQMYVSKSGSNGNAGTDPDLPKLNIKDAIDTAVPFDEIVVGSGIYVIDETIDSRQNNLKADGLVILDGEGLNIGFESFNGELLLEGVALINFVTPIDKELERDLELKDVIVFGGNVLAELYRFHGAVLQNCRFVNCNNIDINRSNESNGILNCIFITCNLKTRVPVKNSYFKDCSIEIYNDTNPNISLDNFSHCYFDNCTFIYQGVTYQSLALLRTSVPTIFNNSYEGSVGLLSKPGGLLNRLEDEINSFDFTVSGASQLLGTGLNGANIGGVRRGLPQTRFSNSIQNGNLVNIVFNGNVFQIQGSNTTGSITTDIIDFGLTVKSPRLTVKGLVNFLENVPDFDNTLSNPNNLDVEARYAVIGEDITSKLWKAFLLNERILLDTAGKSTGETGFNWDDTLTQPMKEIQLRITLRQNYNPA
jgi:uncharacterized protein YjbI with pentapeptide repeats